MFLNQFKQTLKKKEVQDKILACAGSAAIVATGSVFSVYADKGVKPVFKGWHINDNQLVNQGPFNSKPPR